MKSRFFSKHSLEALFVAALVVIVVLTWCTHYNRWTKETWGIPINYVGGRTLDMVFTADALWGMSFAKLTARGEMGFFAKYPESVGAPFGANWNDWPTFEEAVNAWWALLVRGFGLFVGSNLAALSAHLSAALTFYFVCRHLRYDRMFSLMGAGLYGLSRYGFWRNLPNLSLTFHWHLPLALLVSWWCIRDKNILGDRRKLLFCAAVAVIFAVQNAYYSVMFLQFLFWAALYRLLQGWKWREALLPVAIAGLLIFTLAFMNVDTMMSYLVNGPNLGVVVRAYFDVERYALQPLELALPFSHSLQAFADWTRRAYFGRTLILTEQGSSYVGLVAIFALGWLGWRVILAVAQRDLRRIPPHFWGVCLVLAFSILGGLNGLAGVFGFRLFRSSNRFSVVILTILLLFLVKQLTLATRGWRIGATAALAIFLLAFGIFDGVPPRAPEVELAGQRAWLEDKKLVARMEEQLPPDAMVFQMPVRDFPEVGMIGRIDDYEDLRPFVHTSDLTFSHGGTMGRYHHRWQKESERLGPAALVPLLEQYGFSAILINRHGYAENGAELIATFRSLGKERILAQSASDQWICLALNPAQRRSLPPVFAEGWHGLEIEGERNERWSSGDATLVLHNAEAAEREVRLRFYLTAHDRRSVRINLGPATLYDAIAEPEEAPRPVKLVVRLKAGENKVRFTTDQPGKMARRGPERMLAFRIDDFKFRD